MKKKQEEDEKLRKMKEGQQEVMRYLKLKEKFATGDSTDSKRRFREGERDEDPKRSRKDDDRDRRRSPEYERRRREDDSSEERYSRERRRDSRDDRRDRDDDRERQPPSSSSQANPEPQAGSWEEVEEYVDEDQARRVRLRSAFQSDEPDEEAVAKKQMAIATKQKRKDEEKARKTKLKGAFGLDDEDDDESKRDMEYAAAAAAKRAATKRQSLVQAVGSSSAPSQAQGGGGGGQSAEPMDMYQALKKIADFKRSCNGAARPIPPELKAMVMSVRGMAP